MLRQLEYFVQLAREKHFARAAAACFVSQPALSESIRKLESDLGVPLVRRGHSFQGLTPEGEQVLHWAQKMLQNHKSLKQEVDAMRVGLQGTLRLGAVPAVTSTLAELTNPLMQEYPHLTLKLETSLRSPQIVQMLRNFELDAGLIYATAQDVDDLLVLPLYAEKHVLVAGIDLVPADLSVISWEEALKLPLCLLDQSMRGRRVLDEELSKIGLLASPRIESDSVFSLLSHAMTGEWATIVPYQWLSPIGVLRNVKVLELTAPKISPTISLALHNSDPMPVMARAILKSAQQTYSKS